MADGQQFPGGFVWGAATAAYQVEGAVDADGRGPSIWDTFSRIPGKVLGGDTGEHGAQQYTRYLEDIALMRSLHVGAYRFSIAWPRIVATGSGAINKPGLDYYDRLVDGLLDAGIQPWATLYHWDLPQPLEDAGGWPARDTAERFADYTSVVGEHFADRMAGWTTLNEPWCSSFLGYGTGIHAPGRTDMGAAVVAAHHLLLAHGLGVQALRAAGVTGQVGIVLNPGSFLPASAEPADVEAARRIDLGNKLFLDPLYKAAYDDEVLAEITRVTDGAHIRDGDGAIIATPTDYLGINYYGPERVTLDPSTAGTASWPGRAGVGHAHADVERTAMGWEVEPQGLVHVVNRIRDEYGAGITFYVTENGAAYDDEVAADGHVHDAQRTSYIRRHLLAIREMIADGVDIRGYFVWSLLDNFEWSFGYSRRFGVVWTDYDTFERIPKDSARFYAEVARTGVVAE